MAPSTTNPPALLPRRLVLAGAGLAWAGPARAAVITVGGTGTGSGLITRLAESHEASAATRYRILPSMGSGGGLRALAAGRIDLALTLTDPGAVVDGVQVQRRQLARSPVCIVGHPDNPTGMLTSAQAGRLLTLQDRTWPDGSPARGIFRPPGEREWQALRAGPPEIARAADGPARRSGEVFASTAQENAAALASIPGSIGVMSLGQLTTEAIGLRVLGLDDVTPSLEAMRNGEWPYLIRIFMVWRADAPPAITHFITFLEEANTRRLMAEGHYCDLETGA